MLTHMSLFSGVGGIDLAAEWAGFTTIGQCEYADYPTKVLEKHWPDVPRWKDVRDVTRFSLRQRGVDPDGITLLSGGFPCQPHSLAGKRKASADDRDLWGEFARVICETHPRWVLGENVFGLLSSENGRFFGRVLRDLAEMGYRVGWACYGAGDCGAPHERERVFIVANSERTRRKHEVCDDGCDIEIRGIATPDALAQHCFRGRIYKGRLWPSDTRLWSLANGISDWVDQLRCLGNAVVPQQVYPIIKAIADIELSRHSAAEGGKQ
jgi:DNA (cytosine-5)-methyltransferase 1